MNESQKSVYTVLKKYGPMPDQALIPLAQHLAEIHQSSSGIRTRRGELVRYGLIEQVGSLMLPSGRRAAVWGIAQN
jgi:hypothetical protein